MSTAGEVQIRPAGPRDFEQVLPLLGQLWPNARIGPSALRRSFEASLAAPGHFAFCAVRGETAIGFATLFLRESLWQQNRIGYIGELIVDAGQRGRGLGSALIRHLSAVAASHGCSHLELDSAPHRTDAHRFYERCDFQRRSILFSLPLVTFTPEDAGGEIARRLIEQMCSELSARYGTPPSPFSAADTSAPRTTFLVVRHGSEPVGCGALRRLDDDTAELKRMYVAAAARRRGIARRLLAELERCAVQFGYRAIRLETGLQQPEAIALYESGGYTRIPAFGSYVGNPISVCFEKLLAGPPSID
jgi:putative acetyltransferase